MEQTTDRSDRLCAPRSCITCVPLLCRYAAPCVAPSPHNPRRPPPRSGRPLSPRPAWAHRALGMQPPSHRIRLCMSIPRTPLCSDSAFVVIPASCRLCNFMLFAFWLFHFGGEFVTRAVLPRGALCSTAGQLSGCGACVCVASGRCRCVPWREASLCAGPTGLSHRLITALLVPSRVFFSAVSFSGSCSHALVP